MIVKTEKLNALLNQLGWSNAEFAKRLDVDSEEVDKMLAGEPVGYRTSRKFVYFLKARIAQHYIDWDALEISNPLLKSEPTAELDDYDDDYIPEKDDEEEEDDEEDIYDDYIEYEDDEEYLYDENYDRDEEYPEEEDYDEKF